MTNLQQIIQHLFGKESIEEVPVETLEQFAGENPLFGPTQFLLARKYQQTGNESVEKQVQKAALYFYDPLWLHYQMTSQNQPANGGYRHADMRQAIAEPPVSHDIIEEVVTHQEEAPEVAVSPELYTPDEDEKIMGFSVTYDETPEPQTEHLPVANSSHPDFSYPSDNEKQVDQVEEKAAEVRSDVEVPETEEIPRQDNPPPTHPLFPRETEKEDNKITFEPFHTVDYFASQGIKVSAEIADDDRLGKQMKSFTEWLKTMRRLPEAKAEAELQKINDREIEKLAAHSLDDNEVVTEAMAEVFAKQGKHREAIELYHKLSLLNPAKSAYFAAKIEGLNH